MDALLSVGFACCVSVAALLLILLASRCGLRVPGRWLEMTGTALERADMDSTLSAPQWLTVLFISATAGAGACLMLSGAAGLALGAQAALCAAAGAALPCIGLHDRAVKKRSAVARALPGYLDLLTLGLESGCAFGAALQLTVAHSPPGPLRAAMERALQEMRAGRTRAEALQRLERRLGVPALSAAVAAIVQAEATGVSLVPVMRSQALHGTQERFARAEKRAMEAPVKMLAPLVLCIFPCTFIVIGFPIAVRLFWAH